MYILEFNKTWMDMILASDDCSKDGIFGQGMQESSKRLKDGAGRFTRYDEGFVLNLLPRSVPTVITGVLSFTLSPTSQIEDMYFSSLCPSFNL